MRRIINIFLLLFCLIFILTGCTVNDEQLGIEEKNLAELEYIEDNIILIMNKFVQNEYFDENSETQKWDEMLEDSKKLENAMATTLVDLAMLNIDAEEIAKLSTGINNLILAIEAQDEINLMVELNNIYALIPNYLSKYLKDEQLIFKKQLKYYAISTYVGFTMGNIELAKGQIGEAESKYSEKMKDISYVKNNEYNVNKIYVLIQELKTAIDSNSPELVKTKYLLLIEEI